MNCEIIKIDDSTWRIENDGVRFFLLTGSERALMIDSGMTAKNVRELARTLTDLPLELINTHADRDHTGANGEFERVMMHPAEYVNYAAKSADPANVVPVWDGDAIDLGGRVLRVVTLPGHTPGSITLLDEERRCLYGGDPIQDGNIFMFGEMRSLTAYYFSLQKAQKLVDDGYIDRVYPSHGTCPVPAGIIRQLIDGTARVLAGEVAPTAAELFGNKISVCDIGAAKLLCPPTGA